MSAIEKLKKELEEFPIMSGMRCAPTFAAGPGAFPTGVAQILLELIERVERLEDGGTA